MKKNIVSVVVVIFTILCATPPAQAGNRIRPFNRIVIMLDGSLSYVNRRLEAIEKAGELVDKISAGKTARNEGQDEIAFISLDTIPEVVWSGTREQLRKETTQAWRRRFEARGDYARCTDVANGFTLAADILGRAPQATNRFLFAFTDLINEPPDKSAGKCLAPQRPSPPAPDFPWGAFSDTRVYVLWVPVDQKLEWFNAARITGSGENFNFYSESESAAVDLAAPEKAKRIITEEERAAGKKRVISATRSALKISGYGIGSFLALLITMGLGTSLVRRYRGARAKA